jgi:hypothetical protein
MGPVMFKMQENEERKIKKERRKERQWWGETKTLKVSCRPLFHAD